MISLYKVFLYCVFLLGDLIRLIKFFLILLIFFGVIIIFVFLCLIILGIFFIGLDNIVYLLVFV